MVFHGPITTITFTQFFFLNISRGEFIQKHLESFLGTRYYSGSYEDMQLKQVYFIQDQRKTDKVSVVCVWRTDNYLSVE